MLKRFFINTPIPYRNFITYRIPVEKMLRKKNKKIASFIEKKIFVTPNDDVYICDKLMKENNICLLPVVDLKQMKVVGVLNKREINTYLDLQEYHDDEDYSNWNNNAGQH